MASSRGLLDPGSRPVSRDLAGIQKCDKAPEDVVFILCTNDYHSRLTMSKARPDVEENHALRAWSEIKSYAAGDIVSE